MPAGRFGHDTAEVLHRRSDTPLLAPVLWQLEDAQALVEAAPPTPRRATLLGLLKPAIEALDAATDDWDAGIPDASARGRLLLALQAIALIDLLAEVVVRDEPDEAPSAPSAGELALHDAVRAPLAAVRPQLALMEDLADEELERLGRPGPASRQPSAELLVDVVLAMRTVRDRFAAQTAEPMPADPRQREAALLSATLHRHCLERCAVALDELAADDAGPALRELEAARAAIGLCAARLPAAAAALDGAMADVLG
jgi:hypothetical protein